MTPTELIDTEIADQLAAAEAELGRPLDDEEAESIIDEILAALDDDAPSEEAATEERRDPFAPAPVVTIW